MFLTGGFVFEEEFKPSAREYIAVIYVDLRGKLVTLI
jgi:hypothetical protein